MTSSANRTLLLKLTVIAVLMFGFGFALVPFYKKICEATGINNLLQADEVVNTQVDRSRLITIEFDANTHDLPWRFKPLQSSLTVHPGEIAQVAYEVVNTRDQPVTGQAVPSYGPRVAGQYFKKMECFCFARQTLNAGETRQMPVVFVVDPALPQDVTTITLSYTFFEIAGTASKQVEAPASEGTAAKELRG
jgi:cytochrome c oxidase assembly protein subunit 11